MERDRIHPRVHAARRHQRRQRRRQPQPAVAQLLQVQRLLPQPVAREHRAPRRVLDQAEREHPRQPVEHPLAPLGPALQQHLGVGVREERMARPLELRAQLAVVVDDPVEDDRQPERVVDHRLRAALGQVDDREPPVGEPGAPVQPQPRPVRPARRQHLAHPRQRLPVRRRVAPQLTGDAAHQSASRERLRARGGEVRVQRAHQAPELRRRPAARARALAHRAGGRRELAHRVELLDAAEVGGVRRARDEQLLEPLARRPPALAGRGRSAPPPSRRARR